MKVMFLILVVGLCLAQSTTAGDKFPPFLYAAEGAQKILRYGSEGKVVWEYPAPMARDVWALPNGNGLFCFNRDYDSGRHDNPSGVMEVVGGGRRPAGNGYSVVCWYPGPPHRQHFRLQCWR